MAASLSVPAVLIRTIPYGESDLVVTLLGSTCGRVTALAKGARKSQRRFGGGLGLAALGTAALRDRAGAELMLLDSFDLLEGRIALGEDLGRTAHAAYALELCDRLCASRHPEPEVFAWLNELLTRLEHGVASTGRLRAFELGLLRRLGIAPVLDGCARCGRADLDGAPCRWVPAHGGVHCRDCARQGSLLQVPARRALAKLAGLALDEAEGEALEKDVNAACREAMLELLHHYIQAPLRSVQFIAKLGA